MADHKSNTPKHKRDHWATPDWLYHFLDSRFQFDIDLAASKGNRKHENYLTHADNSLLMEWHRLGKTGFLNPPYSNTGPWIKKAVNEAALGFKTVMVIPTPNGESQYIDVFEYATEIIFINGRIAFNASCDFESNGKLIKKGDSVAGNTRGTCIVSFTDLGGRPFMNHMNRDDLIKWYS